MDNWERRRRAAEEENEAKVRAFGVKTRAPLVEMTREHLIIGLKKEIEVYRSNIFVLETAIGALNGNGGGPRTMVEVEAPVEAQTAKPTKPPIKIKSSGFALKAVVKVLQNAPKPLRPLEIARKTHYPLVATYQKLYKLQHMGYVKRIGKGVNVTWAWTP